MRPILSRWKTGRCLPRAIRTPRWPKTASTPPPHPAGTVAVGDTTYIKGAAVSVHPGEFFLVLGPDNGFNEYGVDDFGAVTSIGHVDGGTGDLVITSTIAATTVACAGLIHDAIENIAASGGQTVSILAGTVLSSWTSSSIAR